MGLDYGVNNNYGRISSRESFQILSLAFSNGINILDTTLKTRWCLMTSPYRLRHQKFPDEGEMLRFPQNIRIRLPVVSLGEL